MLLSFRVIVTIVLIANFGHRHARLIWLQAMVFWAAASQHLRWLVLRSQVPIGAWCTYPEPEFHRVMEGVDKQLACWCTEHVGRVRL